MIINTKFVLGGVEYALEVNEPKEIDTLHKAIVLSNPPQHCDICGVTGKVVLGTNRDSEGGFTFIYAQCICGAKANLGQYKSGGYFFKRFEKYVKPAEAT